MRTLLSLIVMCVVASSCTYHICDCSHVQKHDNTIGIDDRFWIKPRPEYLTPGYMNCIETTEIKPAQFYPIGIIPTTVEISPIGTNPMPVEISPIGTDIGIYHPDSGRVIRIRIKNAEHGFSYPNPKHSLSIKGFKNPKDTIK